MRKLFSLTAILITVCSLVALAAFYSFANTVNNDLCTAVEEQAEKIEPDGGKLLWESLSSQFVSSVNY
jgi:hypothetical protein